MPAINLPDDLYQKLALVAARRGLTVDEHVASLVGPVEAVFLPEEQEAAFQKHLELTRARAADGRYPPGFQADISRDAMYPDGDE